MDRTTPFEFERNPQLKTQWCFKDFSNNFKSFKCFVQFKKWANIEPLDFDLVVYPTFSYPRLKTYMKDMSGYHVYPILKETRLWSRLVSLLCLARFKITNTTFIRAKVLKFCFPTAMCFSKLLPMFSLPLLLLVGFEKLFETLLVLTNIE